MARPVFRVERPGLLSTLQDRGRACRQQEGMVVAGAMDGFAAQIANLVVGNGRGEAVLETTLIGPTLTLLSDTLIAVCGADLSAALDGQRLELWKTARVQAGQTLTFGRRIQGARAYLAVCGGFDAPVVLGSRSTFLRANMGGLEGRALRAGDVLLCRETTSTLLGMRSLRPADVPIYETPTIVRFVPGPHRTAFPHAARRAFATSRYTVTPQSDRMGFRLAGLPIERVPQVEMLTEATPFGSIQVPLDGQPIVLMADRQTTGGYPLLGVVVSVDLPRLAQCAPGDAVQFRPVSLAQAQREWIAQERRLRLLELVARFV